MLDDVPVVGVLIDELGRAVVVALVWGLSALAWFVSPWLLAALVVVVAATLAWPLLRSPAPAWTLVPVVVGVALFQLAPVALMEVL